MREPSTHHLPGHKIVRSHSLIWSDSTRSLTKNRKGGNLDGIHISKSLSFDVLGVGIGELLRDGVQTTSNNLNRWHRTNSSTSSGTGMDALKTLDKQPLGHKNNRKMMKGHANFDGKDAMIFPVVASTGCPTTVRLKGSVLDGISPTHRVAPGAPVSMLAQVTPMSHCMCVFLT